MIGNEFEILKLIKNKKMTAIASKIKSPNQSIVATDKDLSKSIDRDF